MGTIHANWAIEDHDYSDGHLARGHCEPDQGWTIDTSWFS